MENNNNTNIEKAAKAAIDRYRDLVSQPTLKDENEKARQCAIMETKHSLSLFIGYEHFPFASRRASYLRKLLHAIENYDFKPKPVADVAK